MATHHSSTPNGHNAEKETFADNVFFSARRALSHHASGGNVLMLATLLALLAANIPGISRTTDFRLGYFTVKSQAPKYRTVITGVRIVVVVVVVVFKFMFNSVKHCA